MKKLLWVFALVFSLSVFSQSSSILLQQIKISPDGSIITMIFNKPVYGTNKGFTIYNTTRKSFSSISGFGTSTLKGKLSKSVVYGEPVNVSYKDIETKGIVLGDLNDGKGNEMSYFLKELVDTSTLIFKGEEKYISATASSDGDGSVGNPWTLLEMTSKLKGGVRYNVKAGNYGNINVLINNIKGSIGNPIIIEGYNKVIGDNPDLNWNYPSNVRLNYTIMPLLDGKGKGSNGFVITGLSEYITVKNFQIKNYTNNLYTNKVNHIYLDNIITENGNRNILSIGKSSRSYNNVITNSITYNGGLDNFLISGNGALIQNTKSYCDETGNPTDYYYNIQGSNHVIRNNYSKRVGNLSHYGHALSISTVSHVVSNKADYNKAEYNFVDGHTSINILKAVELRHGGTKYCVVRGLLSYGEGAGSKHTGGIVFRDNASFNIVENSLINPDVTLAGISFLESKEIGVGLGHDNIVRNTILNGGSTGIITVNSNTISANGYGNKIYNNTFYNFNQLFRVNSSKVTYSDCEFKNNIVHTIKTYNKGNKINGWILEYNDFFKGFNKPTGVGNISEDPMFVDLSNGNFRLKSTSKLIDSGKNLPNVKKDYDGNSRSQGASSDIGAFEYEDGSTNSNDDNGDDTTNSNDDNGDDTTSSNDDNGDDTTSSSDDDKDSKVTNPPPADANAGDDISICLGESVTLSGAGGSTYKWDTGETNKDITIKPTRTTVYELTAIRGGVTNTDTVTVTVENCNISSSLEEDDFGKGFMVYPSPTTGIININVNKNSDKEELNLTLTSINGSIVYSDKMSSNQSEISKQIDLSRLAKGIYFVRLFNSNQNMVKKVLII